MVWGTVDLYGTTSLPGPLFFLLALAGTLLLLRSLFLFSTELLRRVSEGELFLTNLAFGETNAHQVSKIRFSILDSIFLVYFISDRLLIFLHDFDHQTAGEN